MNYSDRMHLEERERESQTCKPIANGLLYSTWKYSSQVVREPNLELKQKGVDDDLCVWGEIGRMCRGVWLRNEWLEICWVVRNGSRFLERVVHAQVNAFRDRCHVQHPRCIAHLNSKLLFLTISQMHFSRLLIFLRKSFCVLWLPTFLSNAGFVYLQRRSVTLQVHVFLICRNAPNV